MATGDHDWTAGEQVTAANMDDYLQLQTVEQFATAAARDTALSARKREGMVTYQLDTNTLTVYSGSAWSTIGPVHGAITAYTPTLTQSGAVTKTVTYASYQRLGRYIMGNIRLDCTGSGTGANAVTISAPVTAASSTAVVGSGYIFDSSAPLTYPGICAMGSTTVFVLYDTTINQPALNALGALGFTAALASGDIVNLHFCYEAAADA